MKTGSISKLLAALLILCIAVTACNAPAAPSPQDVEAQAPVEQQPAEQAPTEQLPAVEPGQETQQPTGDWETTLNNRYEKIAENQVKYAPEVMTLANGVQVQRTPFDSSIYNTTILKADERGCAACHTDLAKTLLEIDSFTGSYFEHFNLTNEIGVEITLGQCSVCHDASNPWYPPFQELMHGLHNNSNEMFKQMSGDCWSCHYSNIKTGEMEIWDTVKYNVLKGITDVPDVEGTFEYSQDVLTDTKEIFALNWFHTNDYDLKRLSQHYAGIETDPKTDGIYDEWTITVTGEVETEVSFTLSELIASAPKVNKISTSQCTLNPFGGPLIANVEITGIPITYLLEQAGVKPGANLFECGYAPNMAYTQKISTLQKETPAYLVYEINGKPLTYQNGYPVVAWFENATAADGRKQPTTIRVFSGKIEELNPLERGTRYAGDDYINKPNIAICNFNDGQIIDAGTPYTFEGYAHGFDINISTVEISFDRGATWTSFGTYDTTTDRWVYWYFTWNPPATGSYVITVRAIAEDGTTAAEPYMQKLINVQ